MPLSPAVSVAISTIVAYFVGGLPFGYWVVHLSSGQDVRTVGSGNIGATNVHRALGRKAGIAVLFLDILKGFIAVWLAAIVASENPVALGCAAVAVMLGHCYPPLLHFRGGKAVACFVGAFTYIAPLALIAALAVLVLVVAITRFVSLGSIVAAWLFPPLLWWIDRPPLAILIAGIVAAALITYRHRSNISRLKRGAEPPFSLKRTVVEAERLAPGPAE